jgi:hypothetical protein
VTAPADGAASVAAPRARPADALAARVVFALLVAASIGAFFLTTRLKRSAPVVQRLTFAHYVSPNGDGRREDVTIRFRTKREDEVTVSILDADDDEVRALARDRRLPAGRHGFRWNGRLTGGTIAPDGAYRVRIGLRKQGRSVTSGRKLFVDTTPPSPVVRYVTPDVISPGAGMHRRARLRFDGPKRHRPTLLVFRTDADEQRLVARRRGRGGSDVMSWDGRVGLGARHRPAAPGNYMLLARVRDAAGNVGPPGPPRRGRFSGHPGVIVSYVSAVGPLSPVHPGALVRFDVAAGGRRYRWSLRRLGSRHRIDHGSSRSARLHVRAPHGRNGVFLLHLQVGVHSHATPLLVQGGTEKGRPGRVLVVLPAATWQATNALDSNGDGFADVLAYDRQVPLRRPFARAGLPPGFAASELPLLVSLDREHHHYDVTTDLALGGGSTRAAVRHAGVLLAGAPRFFTVDAGRILRSYVRAGGRLAWLGSGGFTQPVRVSGSSLRLAGQGSSRRNVFGERLRPAPAALLTVLGDKIDFFRGVGGAFGPFPGLEETTRLPPGARLVASAGSEANRPAIVVYRYGDGLVARLGVNGLAREVDSKPQADRIMRSLWTLLAR